MSITTISISELPEALKNHYHKWVAITGVNNLDSYFENALAVSFPDNNYVFCYILDLGFYINDIDGYVWLFFYIDEFSLVFYDFRELINTTYENI